MLLLLLLLFTISPVCLVHASELQLPQQQPTVPNGAEILENLLEDIQVCYKNLLPMPAVQKKTRSRKRKFREALLTDNEAIQFWPTVKEFLKMILTQLDHNFGLLTKISKTKRDLFQTIIDGCLMKIPTKTKAETMAESVLINADNIHGVQLVEALERLKLFKDLVTTALFFFEFTLNTSFYLNKFALQFELLLQTLQSKDDPNSSALDKYLLLHYQFCSLELANQIDTKSLTSTWRIHSIPTEIRTKVWNIILWMNRIKSHLTSTVKIFDLSKGVESLKFLKQETSKFWFFTRDFLSLFILGVDVNADNLISFSLITKIDEFKTAISSFPLSSSVWCENEESNFSATYSQINALTEFGQSLTQLSILIQTICCQFFQEISMQDDFSPIDSVLNRMKSMLQSDCFWSSKVSSRRWQFLNIMPKTESREHLNAVLEKINEFSSSPCVFEIRDVITEIHVTAIEIHSHLNRNNVKSNDNSYSSNKVSVNTAHFIVNHFLWRPIDSILSMYLQWIEALSFPLEEYQLEIQNGIVANIMSLKKEIEANFDKMTTQQMNSDQVVKIMKYAVDLVGIKVMEYQSDEYSKIDSLLKLENIIQNLIRMIELAHEDSGLE